MLLLVLGEKFLSFGHNLLLFLPEFVDLALVHLDLLEVEALLHGLLVLLCLVVAVEDVDLVFEFG